MISSRPALAASLALSIFALAGGASAAVTVADGDFSAPVLGAGQYEYGPNNVGGASSDGIVAAASGVSFDGNSGVQANGSAWGFAAAPLGATQTAFLQSYSGGASAITLDVSGLTAGDSYSVSFYDARRGGYGLNPISVSIATDGSTSLGTFTPRSTAWSFVYAGSFLAGGSNGQLTFSTANLGGDNDSGLYGVSITQVPEPASWALMLVGLGGLGAVTRRSRRQAA